MHCEILLCVLLSHVCGLGLCLRIGETYDYHLFEFAVGFCECGGPGAEHCDNDRKCLSLAGHVSLFTVWPYDIHIKPEMGLEATH